MPSKVEILLVAKDEASKALKEVHAAMGELSGASMLLKGGLTAASAGLVVLAAGLVTSVKEAMGAQNAIAQLDAVLKSTKGTAGVTRQAALDLSESLGSITRFSHETVLETENMLLTFTNVGKNIFPQATEAVLNMSQALGEDTKNAAIQLGKALNDPINGLTALKRVGVQFTDAQKEMVTKLVESGQLEKAQAIILQELQTEFGGSARAAGETFAGQLERLQHRFVDLQEKIGTALLPLLQKLADMLLSVLSNPAIEKGAEEIAIALGLIGDGHVWSGIIHIGEAFGFTEEQMKPLADKFKELQAFIFGSVLPALQQFGAFLVKDVIPPTIQTAKFLMELAQNVIPVLQSAIKGVADNWETLKPILIAIGLLIVALNAPIVLIIGALLALASAWTNNWGDIQGKTQAATSFISGLIDGFLSLVRGWWSEHGATVMFIVNRLWSGIQTIVGSVIDIIQSVIAAALSAIQSFWQEHGALITQIAQQAWEKIQFIVQDAMAIINAIIDAVAAAISGDWRAFGENLRIAWDAAWDIIKQIMIVAGQALASIGVEIGQWIINSFRSIDWAAVGRSIIEGIIHGLGSMRGALERAAQDAGNAALESIKGALGIHSPSQAFMQIGAFSMQGMALGIAQNAYQPAMAAVGAAQNAYRTTNNYFNQTINTSAQTEPIVSDFAFMRARAVT